MEIAGADGSVAHLVWLGLTRLVGWFLEGHSISAGYPILDSFAFFLAGAGLFVALAYLLPVVSAMVAGYFLDDVAEIVEQTDYPADPPGRALPVGRAILYGLRFAGLSLLVNLAALLLFFIPGVNIAVFFVANAYLLGREYFELAAGRFRSLDEAARMRVENRGTVFAAGAIIAALVMVPFLNLLTPIFGAALMVHVHKRLSARARHCADPRRSLSCDPAWRSANRARLIPAPARSRQPPAGIGRIALEVELAGTRGSGRDRTARSPRRRSARCRALQGAPFGDRFFRHDIVGFQHDGLVAGHHEVVRQEAEASALSTRPEHAPLQRAPAGFGKREDDGAALGRAQNELDEIPQGADLGPARAHRCARPEPSPSTARAMASATSPTKTGWKRVSAPASGRYRQQACEGGETIEEAVAGPEQQRGADDDRIGPLLEERRLALGLGARIGGLGPGDRRRWPRPAPDWRVGDARIRRSAADPWPGGRRKSDGRPPAASPRD